MLRYEGKRKSYNLRTFEPSNPLGLSAIRARRPAHANRAATVLAFVAQLGAAVGAEEEVLADAAFAGGAHLGVLYVLQQILLFQ